MLVLLPPSETKRTGGDGPPVSTAALSFPELDPLRKELLDDLVALAGDVAASRAALGRVPEAITVDVLSERSDGNRAVVSHFNKAHKGRLARVLATTPGEPGSVVRLRALLRRAGFHVEHTGGTELTLVVPAAAVPQR